MNKYLNIYKNQGYKGMTDKTVKNAIIHTKKYIFSIIYIIYIKLITKINTFSTLEFSNSCFIKPLFDII